MKKLIFTFIALVMSISGCVATMEQLPGSIDKSKYAPSNASDLYGVISYYEAHGKPAREDAYKKMHTACNGKYKIINEDMAGNDATVMVPLYGGGAIASNSKKIYIKFICN